MQNLTDIAIFVKVVELSSFTAAAEALGHVAAGREQGGHAPRGKARRAAAQSHDAPAQPDRGRLGAVRPQRARAGGDRERRVGSRALSDRAARPAARVGADVLQHPAAGPGDSKLPDALSRRHAGAEPRRPPGRPRGRRLRCRRAHRPAAGLEPDRTQDRAVPAGDVRIACLSRASAASRNGPKICSSTTASCIRCSARRASGGWSVRTASCTSCRSTARCSRTTAW